MLKTARLLLIAGAMLGTPVHAGTFDPPPGVQFNPDKLDRITAFFRNEIANRKIPGAVVLIHQHGRPVFAQYLGVRDMRTGLPMTDDTIFRLHSMSKPVTSFAAMLLADDGKLKLDDPLSTYIPEFAATKVGVESKRDSGDKVLTLTPLRRPITVRDLLLHISGLTYGFYGDNLARKTVGAANIYGGDLDNAEFARRVARLPLSEQPGTLWDYGVSTDILGRVVEVASGKSLLQFEQERIFAPLGMKETSYFVTGAERQKLIANPVPEDADFKVGFDKSDLFMTFEAGGSGLNSTAADMQRFLQMVLDGGVWRGKRLLSQASFDAMTTDHIPLSSGVARDFYYYPGDGFGFGYGFAVRTDAGKADPPPPGSIGELKWDGASGCYFFIDRKQDFFVLLLEQTPSERQRIQATLKRLVYEALE